MSSRLGKPPVARKSSTNKQARTTPKQARAAGWKDPLRPQQELVSGKWLLSALAVVVVVGAFCAYGTLCLLFYQGSWQLIFHPTHLGAARPSAGFETIQFDYTETGRPQLTGWWIPAGDGARYPSKTILYLHDGRGSLSDTAPQLDALHRLGINVFAFDYRGFGASAWERPAEPGMNQDADAAMAYLTGTRHLPARSIVIYGVGLGAPIAAATAERHPETAGLILERVGPDARTILSADARTRILPVRLLTSDRLDASTTLKSLAMPKLFLPGADEGRTQAAFQTAGLPKQLAPNREADPDGFLTAIQSFLDGLPARQ